ncbi:toprim domain-containing protein [Desulfobacterales bacterium HSG17]|nr:toprim domain-containing protein [Desulfobacterales bacterium HSG17]
MEEQLKTPDYVKYKRLRGHDPDHDKRKYISKYIGNCMMGENSVMRAKNVIITEGAPDLISAIDYDFNAVSPVTTNFKEEHFEKLEQLTSAADSIYIINDNEKNQAGLQGAIRTAKHLSKTGKNVYIVKLPRPDGEDKIDLNEYFLKNSADDLRKLMVETDPFLEWMIKKLPKNLPKALPVLRADIIPIIAEIEDNTLQQYYIGLIKTQTPDMKEKLVKEELGNYKKLLEEQENNKPAEPVDPEIQKEVEKMQLDPQIFKKRIDLMYFDGVTGERNVVATYFAALDSRLLPEPMAVKNSGHWGAGKSYTLDKARAVYPEEAYVFITSGSPKSLYHKKEGLKNKALIVAEAFQFQSGNKKDSEISYVVRTLISEKCIRYLVTEKDEDGKLISVEKVLEGPTAFITTTIVDTVEKQFDDRLHTIHPDESPEQTNKVLEMIGKIKAGEGYSLDSKITLTWKTFHRSLQSVNIIIPFAKKIAAFLIKKGKKSISARRAFSKVFSVLESVTCVYQFQREKDDQGRLIAKMEDYHMALQMVEESFKENLGQQSRKAGDRLVYVEENGFVQLNDMVDAWAVSKTAVSTWVRVQVKEGTLEWCDDTGNIVNDERELKRLKSSGKAYIIANDSYKPTLVTGLPTAYQLTKNPAWDKDGVLYKLYDLQLKGYVNDQKSIIKKADKEPVKEELTEDIKEEDNEQCSTITDIWENIGDIDLRKTS